MKNALVRTLIAAVLSTWFAASALAGFDEGMAAFERGDYAAALEEWLPITYGAGQSMDTINRNQAA